MGRDLCPYKQQNKEKRNDEMGLFRLLAEGRKKIEQKQNGKQNKHKEGQRLIELKQESRLTPYPCKTRCREVGSIRR